MPVNSFDDYYMNFKPDKSEIKTPYIKPLAEKIESEILSEKTLSE